MAARTRADGLAQPKFLTTRQSAARLGVTVNAVKAWIRDCHLPALRTPGGHHRIAETDVQALKARLTLAARTGSRARPRILLVDDHEELLGVIRESLSAAVSDATIRVATDGYEALVEIGLLRPDVLVLDLHIPRVDGFEVCRRLRAHPETGSIRILAITAYPEDDAREKILGRGADDFLEKPFSLAELRARVLALLRAGGRR